MKMVKSLLLVTAAGLVAASGAQAADLPVKAKPVEYVKVCSLYGAGFYYIPGTDICMKLGGYVRYQVSTGVGNSISFGPFNTSGGFNTRLTNEDVAQRVRVNFTMDTRQQTAYGTLRTYLLLGWTHDTPAQVISPVVASVYFNRGFIQIAGFTFGKATSFFDFASTAAVAYNAGFLQTSDTGDTGQLVAAYTAQFGNGMSATFSMEQSRRAATGVSTAAGAVTFAAGPTFDNLGGFLANGTASRPDFVANWRLDQAWGSMQIMGALHDVSAAYYNAGVVAGINELNNHPGDKWGWAAGFGLRLNAPMISPGDYFQGQVGYSVGATRYTAWNLGGNTISQSWSGNSFTWGMGEDAMFGGTATCAAGVASCPFGNGIELTTAWAVFASYEHFWTPALRTSLYGTYTEVTHSAAGNAFICAGLGVPVVALGPGAGQGALAQQCNADVKLAAIGTRSQWNVTKDFYIGLDVIYQKLDGLSLNNGNPVLVTPGGGGKPTALYVTSAQDAVSATWRVHRDIVP